MNKGFITPLIVFGVLVIGIFTTGVSYYLSHSRQSSKSKASSCHYLPTNAGKALCESNCVSSGGCTICPLGGGYGCKNDFSSQPSSAPRPTTAGEPTTAAGQSPKCIYLFWSSLGNCNNSCSAACRTCTWNSAEKYECPDADNSGNQDNSLPKCMGRTWFNSNQNECKNQCGSNCSLCRIGSAVPNH